MKKYLSILVIALALTLTFALVSCNDDSKQTTEGKHIHYFTDWERLCEPTCTEYGLIKGTCKCGMTKNRATKPLGHTYGDWIVDKDATCTENGERHAECTTCGETINRMIISMGHTDGDWIIDKPATSTDDGEKHTNCIVCGEKISGIIPATGYSIGLAYTVNDDGESCTITGIGTCTDSYVVIPSEIDGYKVTAIATRAFHECTTITEITIPETVTNIGTQIFYKASNLHTVYYNSPYASQDNNFMSVASIKKVVFGGCSRWYSNEKYIPSYVLYNCANIETIEITSDVQSIDSFAFYGCSSITSINIPDSVTSIGYHAFQGCSSLTSVKISQSLTTIEDYIFSDCSSLTSIDIPDSVVSIDNGAFNNCSSLTSINIPAAVTNIGGCAFYDCKSLTSIEIPDSVTQIAFDTFWGCSSLTSIIIPDSITRIGDHAFYNCTSLTSIEIPDSVTSIGNEAFYGCSNLTINCMFESQPNGWNSDWNKLSFLDGSTVPVIWGYKGE